jgi:hypothetical protein
MPVVVAPPELTPTFAAGASLRARLGVAAEPATPKGLFG